MTTSKKETDHYEGSILEDVNHKFSLLIELIEPLRDLPAKVDRIDKRLIRVESDVKVIKKVVTAHSYQINDHGDRIIELEKVA